MFRRLVFLVATLFLFAANLSAAQDTIPASEILKVWEKTAIDYVTVHYEDISRTFVELDDDPSGGSSNSSKLITVNRAVFHRAKEFGMRAEYRGDVHSLCNVLNGVGASCRKVSPHYYKVDIEPAGKTHIEISILPEPMLVWLDPLLAPVGKALSDKSNAKIELIGNENGNHKAKMSADGRNYLLMEKYDWRVVEISFDKQEGVPPQWTFDYDRAADNKLVLRKAVSTTSNKHEQFGWMPAFSSEFAVTEVNFGKLTEADIAIKLPTPAVVHDNSGEVLSEFILCDDGTKLPYTKAEVERLSKEKQTEKSAAAKTPATSPP